MKVKITSISEILDDNLTLIERGLLITILLLKESDAKLTLAKAKAKIKFQTVRSELIRLHEKEFIEWSGYKAAIKAEEAREINPQVIEVIDFMNRLYRTGFAYESAATTLLVERLKECSLDQVKRVVANRYVNWREDKVMSRYLTPTTIFRKSKFDKYLEETMRTKEGESLLIVQQINLNQGDEITFEIALKLTDNDVYSITVQAIRDGRKVGTGRSQKIRGKQIKNLLRNQRRSIERGDNIDTIFYYESK